MINKKAAPLCSKQNLFYWRNVCAAYSVAHESYLRRAGSSTNYLRVVDYVWVGLSAIERSSNRHRWQFAFVIIYVVIYRSVQHRQILMKLLEMYILMSISSLFVVIWVVCSDRIFRLQVHLSARTAVECNCNESSIDMATGEYEYSRWNSIGFILSSIAMFVVKNEGCAYVILIE